MPTVGDSAHACGVDQPRSDEAMVLVVGESCGKTPQALEFTGRVMCYSLKDAVSLQDASGRSAEVIDVSGDVPEIESAAWDWATSLVAHLQQNARWLPDDILRAAVRALFLRVFMPIATARRRALTVRQRLSGRPILVVVGVSELERAAIAEIGLAAEPGSEGSSAGVSDEGPKRSSSPRRAAPSFVRSAAIAARTSLRSLRTGLRLWRAYRSVRTSLHSVDNPSTILALAQVPVHLALLRSPLSELDARGWRVVVAEMEPETDLSAGVDAASALPISFGSFLDLGGSMRKHVTRRLHRRKLRERLSSWAVSEGLGAYVGSIVSGFELEFRTVEALVQAHVRMARAVRPSAVMTVSEVNPPMEAAATACRRLGIPTVNVQHGAITELPRFRDFRFDAFCVFGEAYEDALVATGTARETIRITGSPYMDAPVPSDATTEGHSVARGAAMAGDRDCFRILFAGGYSCDTVSDWALFESLHVVLEHVANDPSCSVTVKLHPIGRGQEFGYELALAMTSSERLRVTRDENLYDLIASCDCVATHGSTVAIEAGSLRRPSILVSPGGGADALPLVAEGIALRATDLHSFGAAIEKLRRGDGPSDDVYGRFDRRYAFLHDGKAGSRIADVCEQAALSARRSESRQRR